MRRPAALAGLVALVMVLSACAAASTAGSGAPGEAALTLRLGYFPNLTHATAIVGVENGIFARALGSAIRLEAHTFNAGPDVTEAIFSGSLDASYIGPNPAINAFIKSHGAAIRIISGATSGGASLVVKAQITSATQLRGAKLASPQLGNTQDVALRSWLADKGLRTDTQGGGDIAILPQANGQALQAFRSGQIDGAWVPEPWATRMVREGGGHVLVDERDLWPSGQFVTTQLIVASAFLDKHPDAVKRLLAGQVEANAFVNAHPADAQAVVGAALTKLTGSPLPAGTLEAAWGRLTFTNDPIASSLAESARHAKSLGLLDSDDLDGIYDLEPLNAILAAAAVPTIPPP